MKKYFFISFTAIIVAGAFIAFTPKQGHPRGRGVKQPLSDRHNRSFLFISDVHLNTQSKTTAYGGDTGEDLWAAFLDKAGKVLGGPDQPEFIIYTGDLPAHYSCAGTCFLTPSQRTAHNANITASLGGLQVLAARYHKPIFYLPGNNDALAGDYYSFADEQQQTPFSLIQPNRYLFPAGNHSRSFIPPCIISDPRPGMGYYSASPEKGLRIIALNTVIYNAYFTTVDGTTQNTDGDMQMAWLASQLAEAEARHEKVYLAMHVPPGTDAYSGHTMWATPSGTHWLNTFLGLTTRYKATIAGILYGHTHMDEVRRIYDTTGTSITEVAISCPGVTPQHYNNPGFKLVQYDAASKELMDFTTYFTAPGETAWGDSSYTFSEVYGGSPGTSVYDRLSSLPLSDVSTGMNTVFTVRHGAATYNITTGIEVKKQ